MKEIQRFHCLRCHKVWIPNWIKTGHTKPTRCKFCGSIRWYKQRRLSIKEINNRLMKIEGFRDE